MNIRKRNLRLPADIAEQQTEFKEPETWTIITALNRILNQAEDSHLADSFWESCKNPLAFLREQLGLTDMQIVALAIMVEAGEPVSWKGFARFLNC